MNKVFVFLVIFAATGLVGYGVGRRKGGDLVSSDVTSPSTFEEVTKEDALLKCPVSMSAGDYKKFFTIGNEVGVVGRPQFIDNPPMVKMNKPFNKEEFEKGLYKLSTYKGWDSRKFDVDGDGKDETIINASIAMNHTPHIAMVVKNGNIIFEASGVNIWIEGVSGNQGFLLSETIDWNIGESKRMRYIFKDGGFMLVWTQKICYVQFE